MTINTFRTSIKSAGARRQRRLSRHKEAIRGTQERPRVCVFRSHRNIYAQIIDDSAGRTLAAVSSLDKELKGRFKNGGSKEAAKLVGELLAKRAADKGVKKCVFDKRWYMYHGRVKELAEALRKNSVEF